MIYQDSEQFCHELGGNLASVESEEENEKLREVLTAR